MTPCLLPLVLLTILISLHHAFDIPSSCYDQTALNGTACCMSLQSQCAFSQGQTIFNCTHGAMGVTYLSMRACGLNGTIPNDITKLPFLTYFDLGSNFLTGAIPEDIGDIGMTVGMEHIDLSNNQLSGSIPKSIANDTMQQKLKYLDLSNNDLTKMNLASLVQLDAITHLDLSENRIVENFHVTITEFGSLNYLNLGTNRIAGSIPAAIEDMQQLHTLNLERNDMTGTLPSAISKIPNLKNLLLSDNKFTGDVPDWSNDWGIGKLESLDLGYNLFDCPVRDYSEWATDTDFIDSYGPDGNDNCGVPDSGGSGSSGLDGVEVAIIVIGCIIIFAIGIYCWHAQAQKNMKVQADLLTEEDAFEQFEE